MVLHLAHHKSYHPYNAANIAKVKADEAAAKLKEEAEEQRTLVADSEARIELLRKRASVKRKRDRLAEDPAEQELERQLQAKGKARAVQDEDETRVTIVKPATAAPSAAALESLESNGHINFWADLESGVSVICSKVTL